jgi:hypothetical protein
VWSIINHTLTSLNDAKEEEMGRACSIHWEFKNGYSTFVRKPERRLGRPRHGRIILKRFLEG